MLLEGQPGKLAGPFPFSEVSALDSINEVAGLIFAEYGEDGTYTRLDGESVAIKVCRFDPVNSYDMAGEQVVVQEPYAWVLLSDIPTSERDELLTIGDSTFSVLSAKPNRLRGYSRLTLAEVQT